MLEIDPTYLSTKIVIELSEDDYELLSSFRAAVLYLDDDSNEPAQIGEITGWMTRDPYEGLFNAGDSISADGAILGHAAEKLVDELSGEVLIDAVVMLLHARLNPEYRGQKILGKIIDNILAVLQLHAEHTIVVAFPEPQPLIDGAPRPEGAERALGLRKLEGALSAAGFRRTDESDERSGDGTDMVWWRPL